MNARSLVGLVVIGLAVVGCQAEVASPPPAVTGTIAARATPETSPSSTADQPAEDIEEQTTTEIPSTSVPVPTATHQPLITGGGALPVDAIARVGIGRILNSAISPDDSLLALGTSTGIYVYRVDGLEQVWRKYTEYPVTMVSFSPDSSRLVTDFGSEPGSTLWDAQTGTKIRKFEDCYGGTWSPDGSIIAVEIEPSIRPEDRDSFWENPSDTFYTTGLKLYDSQNGSFLGEALTEIPWDIFWMYFAFNEVIWSADGSILAANAFSSIHVWDVASGQLLNTLTQAQEYETFQVFSLSPDNKQVLAYASIPTETNYRHFYLWDWQSGETDILEFEQLEEDNLRRMDWSPDGATVTLLSGNQMATLDIEQQLLTNQQTLEGLFPIEKVAFSPDGRRVITIQREKPLIVDLSTDQTIAELPYRGEQFEWFHTLPYVLISDLANAVIWDIEDQNEVAGFSGLVAVEDLAWLPDNQTIAWFGGGEFWAYNIATNIQKPITDNEFRQLLHEQFCAGDSESWECIAPDGSTAEAGWKNVDILDPEGVLLQNVDTGDLEPAALGWSPASNLLAIGAMSGFCADGPFGGGCFNEDAILTIWSSNHQGVIAQQSLGQTGIKSLAWSPINDTLAVGMGNTMYDDCARGLEGNEIVLIDPYGGQELYRFTGHSGNVTHLAFSPDGSRLASASADGTIIIWDVP